MRDLFLVCVVFILVFFLPLHGVSQTYGPLSPTSVTSSGGTIGVAWTTPGNAAASDNVYATTGSTGTTRYLRATSFGFAGITAGSTIDGIMVEIERSTAGASTVALLNAWSVGLTKTISAGTNRYLVVIAATENGNGATDVSNMTYGGQAMTQVGEFSVNDGGSFWNRLEVWTLNEAGIAAAGSTTITPTISAAGFTENTEIYSSAVFSGVDQYNPIFQIQNSSVSGNVVPYQLASALNTLVGSMSIAAITCGQIPSAGPAVGGTNT